MEYLDQGGVCIVGSRDSSKSALNFSATLGCRCAREGMTVISSDMRGVDREAVSSVLNRSGRVVIVLSDKPAHIFTRFSATGSPFCSAADLRAI